MSTTFSMEGHEMAEIARLTPVIIANKLADKFVETNWEKLKADKVFMKAVKELSIEKAAERAAILIEGLISERLPEPKK